MAAEPTTIAAVGGFIFTNLPRPWLVPVVLALAITAAVWAWRRYGPPPGGRTTGMIARGCRALAMALLVLRSEERRVGKECKHWCRSRWSPYH